MMFSSAAASRCRRHARPARSVRPPSGQADRAERRDRRPWGWAFGLLKSAPASPVPSACMGSTQGSRLAQAFFVADRFAFFGFSRFRRFSSNLLAKSDRRALQILHDTGSQGFPAIVHSARRRVVRSAMPAGSARKSADPSIESTICSRSRSVADMRRQNPPVGPLLERRNPFRPFRCRIFARKCDGMSASRRSA